MKKKTKLFSLLGLTLLFSVGLIGCGSKKPEENPGGEGGNNPPAVETQINVTAAGNKTTLLIGETVQMSADVEGVKWTSTDAEVATVSSAGLVTAVKVGSTKIRAAKDGYKTGILSITVERATSSNALVDGKTTRLELEDGEFENNNGYWGYPSWSMVPNHDGGETPIEDTETASGGMSLGYIDASTKITMIFTSPAAGKVEMTLAAAYANPVDLGANFTLTINTDEIDLDGAVVPGSESGSYYDWAEIDLGEANVIEGKNTLVLECIGSGANLDYIDMKFTAGGTAHVTPKIVVTPTEMDLTVEETAQINSEIEGLSYVSSNAEVASVSDTGLVTAVKAGNATITVTKEGYKKAEVSVKVKAKPVAGEVILEAEDAILPEETSIQMEDSSNASGAKSLGYFSQGNTFQLKYNSAEAKTVKVILVAASAVVKGDYSGFDNMVLTDEVMSLKFNETAMALGETTLPGSQGFNNKAWTEIDLGNVDLIAGDNVFAFEALSQGPNIDCLKLQGAGDSGEEEEFVVSVPSVADLARLELVNDVPCYIMKITFTGKFDANAKFELFDGERVLPFVKAELLAEAGNAELYFNMSSLEDGAAQFYPHLKVNEAPWNGTDGNVQAWQVFPDGDQLDGAIASGNNKYYIKGAWGMPSIMVIDNLPDAEGVALTGAKVELVEDKAIFTLSGTSTANMSAKKIKIDAQFCGGAWPTTNFANPTVVIKEDGSWTLSVDVTDLSAGSYVIHVFVNGAKYGAGDGNLDLSLTEEQATSATIGSTLYEVKQLTPAPWGDGTITGLVISAVA